MGSWSVPFIGWWIGVCARASCPARRARRVRANAAACARASAARFIVSFSRRALLRAFAACCRAPWMALPARMGSSCHRTRTLPLRARALKMAASRKTFARGTRVRAHSHHAHRKQTSRGAAHRHRHRAASRRVRKLGIATSASSHFAERAASAYAYWQRNGMARQKRQRGGISVSDGDESAASSKMNGALRFCLRAHAACLQHFLLPVAATRWFNCR